MGGPDGAPGSCIQPQAALAIMVIWGVRQWGEDLSPSITVFQINKNKSLHMKVRLGGQFNGHFLAPRAGVLHPLSLGTLEVSKKGDAWNPTFSGIHFTGPAP